jgi:hypothetical protein
VDLCLDILLNVPVFPPTSVQERYKYMLQLTTSNPDKRYWEVGGNECLLVNNDEIVLC